MIAAARGNRGKDRIQAVQGEPQTSDRPARPRRRAGPARARLRLGTPRALAGAAGTMPDGIGAAAGRVAGNKAPTARADATAARWSQPGSSGLPGRSRPSRVRTCSGPDNPGQIGGWHVEAPWAGERARNPPCRYRRPRSSARCGGTCRRLSAPDPCPGRRGARPSPQAAIPASTSPSARRIRSMRSRAAEQRAACDGDIHRRRPCRVSAAAAGSSARSRVRHRTGSGGRGRHDAPPAGHPVPGRTSQQRRSPRRWPRRVGRSAASGGKHMPGQRLGKGGSSTRRITQPMPGSGQGQPHFAHIMAWQHRREQRAASENAPARKCRDAKRERDVASSGPMRWARSRQRRPSATSPASRAS